MINNQIIPECYADTLLVKILGFELPNHQFGIGSVLKELKENFKNRIAVGIIDDDKLKPKDLDDFEIVEEIHGIKRLTKSKHSVLIICPVLEDWIFQNAAARNVDPAKYGFRTRKDFHKACKQVNVADNQQVKQFLNTLKQKNAPGFLQLKAWICEGAAINRDAI